MWPQHQDIFFYAHKLSRLGTVSTLMRDCQEIQPRDRTVEKHPRKSDNPLSYNCQESCMDVIIQSSGVEPFFEGVFNLFLL